MISIVSLIKFNYTQITEYVECKDNDFRLLYKKLKPIDLQHYMYEALKVCPLMKYELF